VKFRRQRTADGRFDKMESLAGTGRTVELTGRSDALEGAVSAAHGDIEMDGSRSIVKMSKQE
jgi:hypothetical protein